MPQPQLEHGWSKARLEQTEDSPIDMPRSTGFVPTASYEANARGQPVYPYSTRRSKPQREPRQHSRRLEQSQGES